MSKCGGLEISFLQKQYKQQCFINNALEINKQKKNKEKL